ncbi:hypothetical protein A2960_04145 [Candidatus Gottesmanbacteria bacterium RIFCSPLOWO2_01_FULL_39_12b]|uniref:Uncharacterized protein n=1 Tax=Candidatus Gottesmanbacteria bacterium RIFCSPLOWO2_01_FULL_39_12b TaxID=1798388 RepID=A0A1F6APE2_9BACT|nr:MAG: hypothetical protein A2960_04145 [Candidatus Gottesmanbacteria bacterium RIFCSPLOWO2_01_FULL_39_12b]
MPRLDGTPITPTQLKDVLNLKDLHSSGFQLHKSHRFIGYLRSKIVKQATPPPELPDGSGSHSLLFYSGKEPKRLYRVVEEIVLKRNPQIDPDEILLNERLHEHYNHVDKALDVFTRRNTDEVTRGLVLLCGGKHTGTLVNMLHEWTGTASPFTQNVN